MGGGGIGISFQNLAEFLQSAGILFCPQAALRQPVVQLDVPWVRQGRDGQMFGGVRKLLLSVIADSQQSASLEIFWLRGECFLKGPDRCPKVSLLELAQS